LERRLLQGLGVGLDYYKAQFMIEISNDKNRLDVNMIHGYLSNDSYWAKGRSLGTVQASIDNSLCFGVYLTDKQIGFARVVSDFSVFAWIMDVFIIEEQRGKGYSKQLMKNIMAYPSLQQLQRWGLGTHDAHGLYQQFGFKPLRRPDRMMELATD